MREERLVCAYEVVQLFSELLTQRLAVLERAKGTPPELTEAVATLLFCASRCLDELQELKVVREQLALKCGAPFAAAAASEATALASRVNERVVAYLSVQPPPPQLKLKRLEEIVGEFGVSSWDAEAARGSILGAAPDLVESAGAAAAWEEKPGAHMFAVAEPEAVAAEAPVVDGWVSAQPAAAPHASVGSVTPPAPQRAVPPLAPLPPARWVEGGAENEGESYEYEYPDAETAARVAVRSAEKAAHAASAAARMAQVAARPAPAPAPQEALSEEGGDEDALAAALPSPPSAAPPLPVDEAGAGDDDADEQAAGGAEQQAPQPDELDELTRRFEELKRKM